MYNGIINVYKEAGFTSHDVVAKLRGILKQKKIGHTGTLDPAATGVLPVCLGSGTKLCDMLTDRSKVYEAVMLLGTTTDTEDTTGTVISTSEVNVTDADIRETIMSFVGTYDQIPPMYSALKVNGQKLCDLARKGIEIERKARSVEIVSIDILEINVPYVKFSVHCSKGTYIRSLCRDIGDKLGTGACMASLVRTRVGQFELENAHTLTEISEFVNDGKIEEYITSVDEMFSDMNSLTVCDRNEMLVRNGNMFPNEKIGDEIRVYFSDNTFAGVYEYDANNSFYKPKKMFLSGKD